MLGDGEGLSLRGDNNDVVCTCPTLKLDDCSALDGDGAIKNNFHNFYDFDKVSYCVAM